MSERMTLTAPAAAWAAVAARPAAAPKTVHRVPPRPGAPLRLAARALKVAVVVDPAALVGFVPADGGRVPIVINVDGRTVKGELNPKSVKKAIAAVAEHGVDKVAVVLQGKLGQGDVLEEAGISAQVKGAPKA